MQVARVHRCGCEESAERTKRLLLIDSDDTITVTSSMGVTVNAGGERAWQRHSQTYDDVSTF